MYNRILAFIFFSGLICLCLAQEDPANNRSTDRKLFKAGEVLFKHAERLSDRAGDDETAQEEADQAYRKALQTFGSVIENSRRTGFDSLRVLSELYAGLIHYYLGEPETAKDFYLDAFALRSNVKGIADSVYFMHYIYTGGIYHNKNEHDSALHYYNIANAIQSAYPRALPEAERLYNRLGVMLYENGNFRQAKNYFEKAIELTDPPNATLITNYRINIASILVKLDELQEAQQAYQSLLNAGDYQNEVRHNLAVVSLKLNQPEKALEQLDRIEYGNDRKNLELYYNYTVAYSKLNLRDSAEYYFQRAQAENAKWNGTRKNVPFGLLLRHRAGVLLEQGKTGEALRTYQLAIMQFHAGFTEEDPREDPSEFSEAYSYINLFQTLTEKAAAFEKLYATSGNEEDLVSSLNTYESAFRLAHFIERTYESDEARLFLNRIKHSAHSRPIEVSLQLFELTGKEIYLESAYLFDQRNKASVLLLNMQENELRLKANNPLLKREMVLRTLVTRLSLRAVSTTDSAQLASLASQIRDAEIELGEIRDQLSGLPEYQEMLLTEHIPTVKDVQRKFDNKTALISWHLSEKDLLALVIRGNKFTYQLIPVDKNFIPLLDSFRAELETMNPAHRYQGNEMATRLYRLMIAPLISDIHPATRLIIIPDDELSYIPFEALVDEKNKYLLDRYSVSYQFSSHFITMDNRKSEQKGTLAFAPFAKKGFKNFAHASYEMLPASLEEVSGLDGTILIDSIATKKNFLGSANKYGTLHLATHAVVNDSVLGMSYIAFYPDNADHRLYANEIYQLRLDSTELVILSACETGMGRLIKGEGLMSLSRAFAFAGCHNIIMSLWKAEDKTTSYLTRKLHEYLDEGITRDEALQRAKLDFLADKSIDPRFKTPNYWAHLMFIGEYHKRKGTRVWIWVAGGLLLFGTAYFFYKKRKKSG